MMTKVRATPGVLLLLIVAGTSAARAQEDWCEQEDWGEGEHACEVREMTLSAAGGRLQVDASPNGGISAEGWDRSEVLVRARVVARADSEARAREILSSVTIESDGDVSASGPDTEMDESWWVSYRVFVPNRFNLGLETTNGGLTATGIAGQIELETTNGGITLSDVAGEVSAETTNGAITIHLGGDTWQGQALAAETTNGGITLHVPEGFSAHLDASVTHGGIEIDFPVTVEGKIGRELSTDLGRGGPPISLETMNGGIRIRRAGG